MPQIDSPHPSVELTVPALKACKQKAVWIKTGSKYDFFSVSVLESGLNLINTYSISYQKAFNFPSVCIYSNKS